MDYKLINFDTHTGKLTIKYGDHPPVTFIVPLDAQNNVPEGDAFEAWVEQVRPNFDQTEITFINNIKTNGINNADTILSRIEPILVPDPILDQTIEEARRYAKQSIDIQVSRIRPLFMTNINGQSLTYYIKIEQAKAFKALGYTGVVPSYIKTESDLTLATPQVTADNIIAAASVFNDDILPRLEAIRVASKAKINAAMTVEDVDIAFRDAGVKLSLVSREIDAINASQSNTPDTAYALEDV